MNIITDVAVPNFVRNHPELHHYTNIGGLTAICQSQSFWAFAYRSLNDTQEVRQLAEPLFEARTKRFISLLKDRQKRNSNVRRAIDEFGGNVASIAGDQAQRMVSSFYDTMSRPSAPLVPYIVSFCTHARDAYAREQGLLSQWRGYGGGGGYCIVLDTAAMVDLLQREFNAHYWVMPPKLGLVHYHTPDFRLADIFAALLDEAENLLASFLDHTERPEIAMGYFLYAAPLLKHQGFREENEARIVAIPATQHDLDAVRTEHGDIAMPPFKSIRTLGPRNYVALFEDLRAELPIKRVIVGPSKNQDEHLAKVRQLLGSEMKIVRSSTPFV